MVLKWSFGKWLRNLTSDLFLVVLEWVLLFRVSQSVGVCVFMSNTNIGVTPEEFVKNNPFPQMPTVFLLAPQDSLWHLVLLPSLSSILHLYPTVNPAGEKSHILLVNSWVEVWVAYRYQVSIYKLFQQWWGEGLSAHTVFSLSLNSNSVMNEWNVDLGVQTPKQLLLHLWMSLKSPFRSYRGQPESCVQGASSLGCCYWIRSTVTDM